ncbi:MAG: prepilin-type N-terminal cleavage/methylation domain-containing protein [Proteobacteria bacterium]|nr:prepilin-type N-terminal cleavage/methylation domain-containing protein [Pseudomonadota bacterium]
MMPRALGRRDAAFTLVELAMTLAMLAVLLGIALPMFGGWRDRMKTGQAQDDIIAIALVLDQRLLDTGQLPESLADIGRGGVLDPWGHPYEYLNLMTVKGNGKARKDHNLVPLNTDYDLYSKGPDGASTGPLTAKASRDDILRANNGRFIGPASAF